VPRERICSFVSCFIRSRKPSVNDAWKAVYELLLWYSRVDRETLPHIIEINMMRRGLWRDRAKLFEDHISKELGYAKRQLPYRVDSLIRGLGLQDRQRQNYLGIGFVCTVKELVKRFVGYDPLMEVDVEDLKGFEDVRRYPRRRADLVLLNERDFRVLLSTKWSLRHDRLKDLLNEAEFYKRRRPELMVLVVTNEFMSSRLARVAENGNIDYVIHVNRKLVEKIIGRTVDEKIKDLSEMPEIVKKRL